MSKAKDDEKIVKEAKKRFDRCEAWESTARKRWLDDLKFCNGDAYNRYQWPTDLYNLRDDAGQPCLTINKTRQHCLQIINDARQNKSSIKVSPTGGDATYEAAQVYAGVIRHIEYNSDAQTAYSTATWYQVEAGIGYIRVATDYAGPNTFDQEIYIRRVADPLSVYMDPDAKQYDRSDAKFAFVFDDIPKEEFDTAYPKYRDRIPSAPLGASDPWLNDDHVRVAEYFRCVPKADKLVATPMGMARMSALPEHLRAVAVDDPETQIRDVEDTEVEWYLIIGEEIVERRTWPGSSIPIVPVIGEETVIDGIMDRKGHTRSLIDPQRMYNYWTSEATAQVAYQGKTPFVAPVGSFENLIEYYENANRQTFSVLPYNPYDDQGRPLPAPEKAQPPIMSPAYLQGMQTAAGEMAFVSGQYQAEFGAPSNERSGTAITQRQRQADNATYHFVDHLAMSIRRVGKILIELIPKVYDTPRLIKILAEDDVTETSVQIDPNAPKAMQEVKNAGKVEKIIFNPGVGEYEVQADIGPAFGTRRQEAFNALTQLAGQSPELMKIGGDLVFRAADFPMANELAERWQRTIPPNILGDGPDPALEQLQQQVQTMQHLLQVLGQKLQDKETGHDLEQQQKLIDAYKAESDRLKALGPNIAGDPGFQALVRDTIMEAVGTNMPPGQSAAQPAPDMTPEAQVPPAAAPAPPVAALGGA